MTYRLDVCHNGIVQGEEHMARQDGGHDKDPLYAIIRFAATIQGF